MTELPSTQPELTYSQIHQLVEDMYISWQFLRINFGECELKGFHQTRFDHLKEVLKPYYNEVKGGELHGEIKN